MSKHQTQTAPATIEAPADLREYATLGAAMEIDRMFAALPVLYRAVVATKPGQSVAATVAQAIAEQNSDPNGTGNGTQQPDPHPEQPERQLPHRAPRTPAKHPRGKQRNPATHRSPRGHHAPPKRRTRAPMTSAQRKAVSERMRQYWAQRRMH